MTSRLELADREGPSTQIRKALLGDVDWVEFSYSVRPDPTGLRNGVIAGRMK